MNRSVSFSQFIKNDKNFKSQTPELKLQNIFLLFDNNDEGILRKHEVRQIIFTLFLIKKQPIKVKVCFIFYLWMNISWRCFSGNRRYRWSCHENKIEQQHWLYQHRQLCKQFFGHSTTVWFVEIKFNYLREKVFQCLVCYLDKCSMYRSTGHPWLTATDGAPCTGVGADVYRIHQAEQLQQ